MNKRLIIIAMLTALVSHAWALNMRALADSLNHYARERAAIDLRVRVKNVSIKGNQVFIYTNDALGCLCLAPNELEALRHQAGTWAGVTNARATIYSGEYELGDLITARYKVRKQKTPKVAVQPLLCNENRPYQIADGLEGRHIALWASHGWFKDPHTDLYRWQRARLWTTVEDVFTTAFVAPYLVPMLENAGAVVLQPRAYVRPGYQTVYLRWAQGNNAKQEVIVYHGNQSTHYSINTQLGSGVWQYLCTVESDSISVEGEGIEYKIVNSQSLGHSGRPIWVEAAWYWLQDAGYDMSLLQYDNSNNDYLNDLTCRGKWVNYLCGGSVMNPNQQGLKVPVDMSLAFHTDAGSEPDSIIGTLGIYTTKDNDGRTEYPSGDSRIVARDLTDYVMTQIINDLRDEITPRWTRRKLLNGDYSESRHPVVPAMILELLGHQNYTDMQYALNPEFKFKVARAVYKGIGRFLAQRNNRSFIPQPLPPHAIRTMWKGDSLHLSWSATIDPIEDEARSTYYVIHTRENDGDWDNGTVVYETQFDIVASKDVRYDFYVVAGNDGGISMPSTKVSAFHSSSNHHQPMLVVDAFTTVRGPLFLSNSTATMGIDPWSRPVPDNYEMAYIGEQVNYNPTAVWCTDDDCGFGQSNMNRAGQLLMGNTHDYTIRHGKLLQQMNINYAGCTMDAVSAVDTVYRYIDIVLGKSNWNTVKAMNGCIEAMNWTKGNKKVLISGAYVGYPQHACASGEIIYNGRTIEYIQEINEHQLSAEDVSAVTKIAPQDQIIARYSDTGLSAAIEGSNYIIWGLPLESMKSFNTIYKEQIEHLIKE
ncbi:MAG: hypothetical protein MJZ59_00445 [Paludibacteraceae bacterium]|nr:hypothetical protein [Paludibacteraceae bacterium]